MYDTEPRFHSLPTFSEKQRVNDRLFCQAALGLSEHITTETGRSSVAP